MEGQQLETERLLLRSMEMADAQAVFEYRSDADTNQYQGWLPKTLEDVHAFIEKRITRKLNENDSWHQLVIILKEENKIIGDIGMHFIGEQNDQTALGFTLQKNYHGQGYATESVSKVVEYLFTELNKHRLLAHLYASNTASKNLVKRLGFRKEAHFVKSTQKNGHWEDELVYAMLREEWKEQ